MTSRIFWNFLLTSNVQNINKWEKKIIHCLGFKETKNLKEIDAYFVYCSPYYIYIKVYIRDYIIFIWHYTICQFKVQSIFASNFFPRHHFGLPLIYHFYVQVAKFNYAFKWLKWKTLQVLIVCLSFLLIKYCTFMVGRPCSSHGSMR